MNVTALGICPPPTAQDNPSVTPELLASTLARYSRSNKGIETILQSVNWDDPDKSVDAIFRFVDYGHASIAGMTGGIPIIIDGCSMYLAYKIFEIAQLCDGQESSTRYIKLHENDVLNLSSAKEIGIPTELAEEWQSLMSLSFIIYRELYEQLDRQAQENPSLIRVPEGTDEKVINRLRKNYALDRARYFIPFASRTNAAYIMTARVWADTIRQLDALPLSEAHTCAAALRTELEKYTPRLIRHSFPDDASLEQTRQMVACTVNNLRKNGLPTAQCPDEVFVKLEQSTPAFLPDYQEISAAFDGKQNRYSITGTAIRRKFVRAAWNNMAIAELRDLNRHRSGFRFCPMQPVGFYLPEGISHPRKDELLNNAAGFIRKLISSDVSSAAYIYALHLGTQVPFEHSTHLDKFIYEIELRTGVGAHFRYAEHLQAASEKLCANEPQLQPFINVGTAEPE